MDQYVLKATAVLSQEIKHQSLYFAQPTVKTALMPPLAQFVTLVLLQRTIPMELSAKIAQQTATSAMIIAPVLNAL
jgi:hypothetical protein